MNAAVNQLDRMTQQNAALVEQSAAAADSLKDQAGKLAAAVATFRVEAGAAALGAAVIDRAQKASRTPAAPASNATPPTVTQRRSGVGNVEGRRRMGELLMNMPQDMPAMIRPRDRPPSGSPAPMALGGEYLTFRLGAEEYGIEILKVQEIRSYEPPTRIANAPPSSRAWSTCAA